MTWLNHIAFFLICLIIIVTVLFYGTVHQPTISFFYLLTVALVIVWTADAAVSGKPGRRILPQVAGGDDHHDVFPAESLDRLHEWIAPR